mmetsp:Transcript_2052/g.3977  ORF Transcript_2052/g.3977 Transcript_2052/m.3977 type:complete len:142 (-) Transcript_2052:86-511(-)
MTGMMVSPPKSGDDSFYSFKAEEDAIFTGLAQRARKFVYGFNRIQGIECQPTEGAMHAFPKLDLPESAKQLTFMLMECKRNNMQKCPVRHYTRIVAAVYGARLPFPSALVKRGQDGKLLEQESLHWETTGSTMRFETLERK